MEEGRQDAVAQSEQAKKKAVTDATGAQSVGAAADRPSNKKSHKRAGRRQKERWRKVRCAPISLEGRGAAHNG